MGPAQRWTFGAGVGVHSEGTRARDQGPGVPLQGRAGGGSHRTRRRGGEAAPARHRNGSAVEPRRQPSSRQDARPPRLTEPRRTPADILSRVSDRRKHWGWGAQSAQPTREALEGMRSLAQERLGFGGEKVDEPVPLDGSSCRRRASRRRRRWPRSARTTRTRALRTRYGRRSATSCAAFAASSRTPPDVVARAAQRGRGRGACSTGAATRATRRSRTAAARASSAASSRGCPASIRASSRSTSARSTACSRSTRSRARRASRPARSGPALEDQLARTASRCATSRSRSSSRRSAAGSRRAPAATTRRCYTHIDDFVESRARDHAGGVLESRRLPGSGAGPSPDRLLLGSEGTLGVITEAWMRVHAAAALGVSAASRSTTFAAGAAAVRAIAQSGLYPANCRLLDRRRGGLHRVRSTAERAAPARLRVRRSPARRPMRARSRSRADHGGEPGRRCERRTTASGDARRRRGAWRQAFLARPYLRDSLVARRRALGHVRDRDHLGALRGVSTRS